MKNLDRVYVFLKNKKPHDKRNKMDYNIFIFELEGLNVLANK
jgi:hypothetical protein